MFSLNLQTVRLQSVFLPLIKTVEAVFGTSTMKNVAKMMLSFKTVIHTSQAVYLEKLLVQFFNLSATISKHSWLLKIPDLERESDHNE